MIREIFKMLNQYAVDIPTLPVKSVFFPRHPVSGGMVSRSLGMPSRQNGTPSIWDKWCIGKRFLQIRQRQHHHM